MGNNPILAVPAGTHATTVDMSGTVIDVLERAIAQLKATAARPDGPTPVPPEEMVALVGAVMAAEDALSFVHRTIRRGMAAAGYLAIRTELDVVPIGSVSIAPPPSPPGTH